MLNLLTTDQGLSPQLFDDLTRQKYLPAGSGVAGVYRSDPVAALMSGEAKDELLSTWM
jgi:hypothetical protein